MRTSTWPSTQATGSTFDSIGKDKRSNIASSLSSAPRVFTQVLNPVIVWLRSRGVALYAYLDDILILGSSPQQTKRAEDRCRALLQCVNAFLKVGVSYPARTWLKLLGVLAATIPSVAYARLHARPIQWYVKRHWRASRGLLWPVMVRLNLVTALQWWTESLNLSQGLPFQSPSHDLTVTTDSSMEGWGGFMKIPGSKQDALFSGDWSQAERRLHINLLEL